MGFLKTPLNTCPQNRLTSEQASLIIKNLAKLPSQLEIVVYPTLVTIITDNPEAQEVIGREFDLKVREAVCLYGTFSNLISFKIFEIVFG